MVVNDNSNNGNGANKDHVAEQVARADKDKTALIRRNSLENLYTSAQGDSVPKLLVDPGKTPMDISMRTVLQLGQDGVSMATAIAHDWAQMVEFNDEQGQRELLMMLALKASVGGVSRNQLVQAVVGDANMKSGKTFMDKIKTLAFGPGEGS